MATNKKISQLIAAAALTGAEQVPVVQSGVTVRTTTQAIADLASGGGGGGGVESVVAGSGIRVDSTDPVNPIVSRGGVGDFEHAGVTYLGGAIVSSFNIIEVVHLGTGSYQVELDGFFATANAVPAASLAEPPGGGAQLICAAQVTGDRFVAVYLYNAVTGVATDGSWNLYVIAPIVL